jgi:hypothetical protein
VGSSRRPTPSLHSARDQRRKSEGDRKATDCPARRGGRRAARLSPGQHQGERRPADRVSLHPRNTRRTVRPRPRGHRCSSRARLRSRLARAAALARSRCGGRLEQRSSRALRRDVADRAVTNAGTAASRAALRLHCACPQRDSNPRYSLERAVTWAASRWGPGTECRGVRLCDPSGVRAVSSAGRAPALHAGGRRFKPCTAHLSAQDGIPRERNPVRAHP